MKDDDDDRIAKAALQHLCVWRTAEKFSVTRGLWFDGIAAYSKLFRPYLNLGAELYGTLLPANWNGTRTV